MVCARWRKSGTCNVLKYCVPSIALIYLFVEWLKPLMLFVLACAFLRAIKNSHAPLIGRQIFTVHITSVYAVRCEVHATLAHHRNSVNFDSFVWNRCSSYSLFRPFFPCLVAPISQCAFRHETLYK